MASGVAARRVKIRRAVVVGIVFSSLSGSPRVVTVASRARLTPQVSSEAQAVPRALR
jgi:hypothetical protein